MSNETNTAIAVPEHVSNQVENTVNQFQITGSFATCVLTATTTTFCKKLNFKEVGNMKNFDKDVIFSGVKLLITKEVPAWFKSFKAATTKVMETYCIKMSKRVWLIPLVHLDKVTEKLKEIGKKFHFKKQLLELGYEDYVETHAEDCDHNPKLPPSFGDVVRNECLPWEEVDRKLQFGYALNVDVQKAMAYDFLDDVAKEAKDHWETIMTTAKTNKAKPKITLKNINRLKYFKDRLKGGMVLEPKAQYVIDVIDEFILNHRPPFAESETVSKFLQVLHLMMNKEVFLEMINLEMLLDERKLYTLAQLQDDLSVGVKLDLTV